MKRTIFSTTALALGIGAVAWAQTALRVEFNGRAITGNAIRVDSRVYVSAEALRGMGMSVSLDGSTVRVGEVRRVATEVDLGPLEKPRATPTRPLKRAEGGAVEQPAVEGRAGEWLFNGIWRFRVLSVQRGTGFEGDHPGWRVKMEIRNGTQVNGYSPGGTGFEGMQLVLEDGESVEFQHKDAESDFFTPRIAQGAGRTDTLVFETRSMSRPTKLVMRLNPEATANIPLKYTIANPSFRVDLRGVTILP